MRRETVIKKVARFDAQDIDSVEDGTFYFTDCLLSCCSPVFDHMGDNYDVSDELVEAGVITEQDEDDSESGQFAVVFESREQGEAFIARLNDYLDRREEAIRAAYPTAFERLAWD